MNDSSTLSDFDSAHRRQNGPMQLRMRLLPCLVAGLMGQVYADPAVTELPTGGQIAAGQGSISQQGANMNVQQTTQRMIANWQTFNVGEKAAVNFQQPSTSAVALNRVLSANPSQIFGKISANGHVLLSNPSGVVFGPKARIDVGGMTASSLKMRDADFMAGRNHLTSDGGNAGKVANYGEIAAREGGYVALVGGQVDNAGKITAPGGQVALVAGSDVHLNIGQTGLVSVKVNTGADAARVDNAGLIVADGGKVWLTAKSASPALASAVNQRGTVQANSVATRNGEVWIEASGGETTVTGTVQAKGVDADTTGGKIVVTGDRVVLEEGSHLDAGGDAGGGSVHVGGGWQGKDPEIAEAGVVVVKSGARIAADAARKGKGGTVSVWSSKSTQMDGAISARGGQIQGDGGKVETSSKGSLGLAGAVDVSSLQGKGGEWLLDPYNLVVSSAVSSNVGASPNFTATGSPAVVQASSIESALNGGTAVILSTGAGGAEAGNIDINENISKTAGAAAKLTFDAANNITLASGKSISSIFNKLDIDFGTAPTTVGTVTLNGTVSTNGGSVNFYKPTALAHATPVSTKITETSNAASGNITFWQDVSLAAPGYSVSLDASGPQSGGAYTGRGGAIEFKGSIASAAPTALPHYSQALALTTSGADSITPLSGPGAIILGGDAADTIGGTDNAALKSLTMTGPTTIQLNAGTINLMDTSGSGLFASSTLGTPMLELGATDTVINVKGGTRAGVTGYSDYVQSTFDIGVKDATDRTLTINSDRSIKIKNHVIDATGGGSLSVTLNPFEAPAAVGGAIILDNASIISNGANIRLGGAADTDYAVGYAADDDGIPDGIRLTNSKLISGSGDIVLRAKAPETAAAGAAIRLSGAQTDLNAGAGNITLEGQVDFKTNAGNKDAVIIGEGGASRVTLQTSSGNISVLGDASGVGVNPGGGSRYDGVILSSRALLKTASGDISITGVGGGGDHVYIAENHGIKLEDTETSVVTSTGNIALTGTYGGKTSNTQGENSYGIHAKGNSMYLGSAPDPAIDNNGNSAVADSGNITITADSMELVNSSSFRLQVASSGELNIKPLTANRDIRFSDTPAVDALVLGNDWFNGSSVSVFQPGFGTGAGYGTAASGTPGAVTIGRIDGTGLISVASTTTIRDNATLLNGSGNTAINAPLTVQGSSQAARTLTIATAGSVAGTGAVTSANLMLLGSGDGKDFALTGNNLVGTLAASTNGRLAFNNAQRLSIGSASSEALNTVRSASGIVTSNDDVGLSLSSGDLTLDQDIAVGSATASLVATTGAVNEAGSAKITANQLYVASRNTSTLDNANAVNVLAANVANQNLRFTNTQSLQVGRVGVTPLTPVSDGSVSAGIATDHDGIVATGANSGLVRIHLTSGDLSQASTGGDVRVTGLQLAIDNGNVVLDNSTNRIGTVAANLTALGKVLSIKDHDGLTVGSVTVGGDTLDGITTDKGDVSLAASADSTSTTGGLTLEKSVDTGVSDVNDSTTVRLSAGKGSVSETNDAIVRADKLYVQATAAASDATSSLNNGNDVNTLSANLAGVNHGLVFRNAKSLVVGSVDANNGVVATGNVELNLTAGDLSQTANGSGDIRGAGLLVRVDTGSVTLENTTNDVDSLAAVLAGSGESISYRDADALTVGTVNRVEGVATAADGNIDIRTVDGTLTVAKAVSAQGAGSVDLRAGGVDSDLAVNNAVSSGSGALQAVAGRAMTTSHGAAAGEFSTSGSLLLDAGSGIGTSDNKIRTDVATVAAQSGNSLWFSQVDGSRDALTIGSVAGINGHATVNGLTTSANNGSIFAETQAGTLAVQQAVSANGSGNVDLRAGGAAADLMLDATVGNTAADPLNGGIIALTAGHDIKTGSTTGVDNEVVSVGSLRLQAGGSIGEDARRLDVQVSTLAAKAVTGDIWIAGRGNGLTLGAVATVNGLPALNGVTTNSADKSIAISNSGSLTVTKDVTAIGNGKIDLRADGGDLAINGATVKTTGNGAIQLVSSDNITTNTANGVKNEIRTGGSLLLDAGVNIGDAAHRIEMADVATLAARAGGNIALQKTTVSDLTIGTVAGLNGHADLSGLDADGSIWVRTKGNMRVRQPVEGRGAAHNAVVLAADKGFYNYAGAQGVSAPNGRWLIYDSNPTLEDRLGGLQPNFTRFATHYDTYPAEAVQEQGNGYLNDAITAIPEQYMRTFGGPMNVSNFMNNVALSYSVLATGILQPVSITSADYSTVPALGAPLMSTPPVLMAPIQLSVQPGRSFTASLEGFVGGDQQIDSVQLANGERLPAWISFSPDAMTLHGRVPEDFGDTLSLIVKYHRKNGDEDREIQVRLTMAALDR